MVIVLRHCCNSHGHVPYSKFARRGHSKLSYPSSAAFDFALASHLVTYMAFAKSLVSYVITIVNRCHLWFLLGFSSFTLRARN